MTRDDLRILIWNARHDGGKVGSDDRVIDAIEAAGIPLIALASGEAVAVPVNITLEMLDAGSGDGLPSVLWKRRLAASPYARPAQNPAGEV